MIEVTVILYIITASLFIGILLGFFFFMIPLMRLYNYDKKENGKKVFTDLKELKEKRKSQKKTK